MRPQALTHIFYGIRHLLGARFWTPPSLRPQLARWHECSPDDEQLREILHHWHSQQLVAWSLARILTWAILIHTAARMF